MRVIFISALCREIKHPVLITPLFFWKNSRGDAARKFWPFFLSLGGKSQKIWIQKRWVNNFPFLGQVGLFDRGCFIALDKVPTFASVTYDGKKQG